MKLGRFLKGRHGASGDFLVDRPGVERKWRPNAKEVGMGNPAEETIGRQLVILCVLCRVRTRLSWMNGTRQSSYAV
jgi:hypothetical protein